MIDAIGSVALLILALGLGIVAVAVIAWIAEHYITHDLITDIFRRNPKVSPEDLLALRKQISNPCTHCGGLHSHACWRVKAIEFRADGMTPARVEFWEKWDRSDTVFPDEVFAMQADAGSVEAIA